MIHSFVRAWGLDNRGQIAVIFAILLFPIFLIAGFNLDVARYVSANKKVQVALDAAALAGARAMQDASLSDDNAGLIDAYASIASRFQGVGLTE